MNQSTSVSTARKAIADYKKATGQPEGLAELMVFFCERAAGFSNEVGLQDEGYAGARARMFGHALRVSATLGVAQRDAMLGRLDAVRRVSHGFGYGVGDDMDALLAEFGVCAMAVPHRCWQSWAAGPSRWSFNLSSRDEPGHDDVDLYHGLSAQRLHLRIAQP
jgi:hypothetical protein